MKHIGLDVHSTTTSICVIDDRGKRLWRGEVPSTAKHLRAAMENIRGEKRAVVEESQMADWVARELSGLVDEMIRCQPQQNRLISGSEDKSDTQDAESLAVLLRLNELKAVHHPSVEFHQLREGIGSYWRSSRDLARAKQRLKAYFLHHGAHEPGGRIHAVRYREVYRQRLLLRKGNLELAESLWQDIDYGRQKKLQHLRLMKRMAKRWAQEVRRVQSIPGVGVVGACTLVAYLEGGYRFGNKRKLWRYGGVGLRRHESGGSGYRKASRSGNRHVKNAVLTAVASIAAGRKPSALWDLWQQGLAQGVDVRRLRRNLGRKVLVIAQHLLRQQQEYDDAQVIAGWTGSRQQ